MGLIQQFKSLGIEFQLAEINRLRFGPKARITSDIRLSVITNKSRIISELIDNRLREILSALPPHLASFSPSLQELSDILGVHWEGVACDPYLLAGWVSTIRTNRMVEAGVIPPLFTEKGICKKCGPVLLEGGPNNLVLEACPWCFSENKPDFSTLS